MYSLVLEVQRSQTHAFYFHPCVFMWFQRRREDTGELCLLTYSVNICKHCMSEHDVTPLSVSGVKCYLSDCFCLIAATCSSISVAPPLPLAVLLSSLNKQTRSSCQLCPSSSTRPAEPIATCPGGIPNMQLSDPSSAAEHNVTCCHRDKYGPTPFSPHLPSC